MSRVGERGSRAATTVPIEDAVDAMAGPGHWVRVEKVQKTTQGLELSFAIHNDKRGKKVDTWSVACSGVLETHITDLDGGGIAVYDTTHPAARQWVTRLGELRWRAGGDEIEMLGALYDAHAKVVDDWIPFWSYAYFGTPEGNGFLRRGRDLVVRGPDFLLRAYAKALRASGERPRLTLRKRSRKRPVRPKVLHFGTSYIVAAAFVAQRREK